MGLDEMVAIEDRHRRESANYFGGANDIDEMTRCNHARAEGRCEIIASTDGDHGARSQACQFRAEAMQLARGAACTGNARQRCTIDLEQLT